MDRLHVVVAASHHGLRRLIVALLRSKFEVVDHVGDGEQLIQAAIDWEPDVIVSDIILPLMDGFSVMRELRSRLIEVPFVFMTMLEMSRVVPSFIKDEPLCYVHKLDLDNELSLAVQSAADGQPYMSRSFRKN